MTDITKIDPFDTMNIDSEKGTRVLYTGKNGYDSDKEHADNYLTVGEVYTVDFTDVGGSNTTVYLQEFPNKGFNSVHFVDVEKSGV